MIEPFICGEFEWVKDDKSGKTVLVSPWFNDLGVWHDVPCLIVSNSIVQVRLPMPDQIVKWSDDRRRLACDLLNERLLAEMVN